MRCPVCRAQIEQGPQCRRCRADLSLLFAVEKQRQNALAAAYRCLAQRRWQQALALAEGADTLRRDEDSRRLRAVLRLLERDFEGAWRAYTNAVTP
jgi:hypothetical protein